MNDVPLRTRFAWGADLAERAARDLRDREEGSGTGTRRAQDALEQAMALISRSVDPEADYREGLFALGVALCDIDEAVTESLSGRNPADSLHGRVAEYRRKAAKEADDQRNPGGNIHRMERCEGEAHALGAVQGWLGAKP